MKCPACGYEITDATPECAICKFHIQEIDGQAAGLPKTAPLEDIYDPQGMLSRAAIARLQVRIDEFEARTKARFHLVLLPSVKPLEASLATFWMFNQWNLGGAENRAVLLVLALEDRKVQCEVGYGLEAALSDSEAARVLDYQVVPLLQRGLTADALFQGVELLAELIETSVSEIEPSSTDLRKD